MADLPAADRIKRAAQSREALLATFIAAIFLSAALLFLIEPMFTKMVLPRLGGSPSVWSVAMVFFQAVLLAGYAYAHVLTRWAPGRMSILIHLAVMALAASTLPLAIGAGRPPASGRGVLAARPVRGLDRAAVLRARRQWAAAAGLVRAHRIIRPPRIPIFSMRRAMSAAFSPCCPIRRWSSLSSR